MTDEPELYGPPDPFRHLRRPTIEDVIQATSFVHQLPRPILVGPKRNRDYSRPRQSAMYVAYRRTGRSLPEIGRAFGGRDHSTVCHARDQIKKWMLNDRELAASVLAIDQAAQVCAAERLAEARPRLMAFYKPQWAEDTQETEDAYPA